MFIEAAMKEELPDFFTPYAYVRYLIDRPLQPKGPISRQDLRRSIQGPFPTADLVGAAALRFAPHSAPSGHPGGALRCRAPRSP